MSRAKALLFLLIAALAGLAGMSKIDKDVDLLHMLPEGLRAVEGLKIYRTHFVREEELVIAITGSEAATVKAAAQSLAEMLENAETAVTRTARWRESGEADIGSLAELAAYAWLNAPPEEVSSLTEKLVPERLESVLKSSLDTLTTTPNPREIALLQYDPLRLLEFPGWRGLLDGLGEQKAAFSSEDALLRLIFLEHPSALNTREEIVTWIREVEKVVEKWKASRPTEAAPVNVALTGEAALQTETIDGMQNDLTGSVIGTSLAVALLFFLMHRRMLPLLWLMGALAVTLVITIGFAAITYGQLSAMSAGFAAILLALVADYGVLAWQEGKSSGKTGRALLLEIGPSIFWAALTTAAVFFGLNFSSFPGIAQLGNLVGAGILAGAGVIGLFYLPTVSRLLRSKKDGTTGTVPARTIHSRRRSPKIIALLLAGSGIVFVTLGLPPLNESYWALRPKNSPALEAIENILERMPLWAEARLPIVITNEDEKSQVWETFREVETAGFALADSGKIKGLFVPACLWPDSDRQRKNLATLAPLLEKHEVCRHAFEESGFGDEAGMFHRRVLDVWRTAREQEKATPCLPENLPGDWPTILKRFVSTGEDGSGTVLLGQILPVQKPDPAADPYAELGPLNIPGVYPSGWESLQGATWPLMVHDFRWVFAPMTLVLLLMLTVVYRNFRQVTATLVIMALTWTFLIATMALIAALRSTSDALAWLPVCEWNFMNLAAIPLLMGTGLDYSIHITLSVRRHHGDLGLVWQRTGKAVILCGLSTAAGFGSLAFASNRGLSSLGTVCSLGILITTALAVIALPRMLLRSRPIPDRPDPDTHQL